ncbi:MAG TPA: epoxide hydrolase [Henriciella marina]|uniref:epoxide hydrolase family protein n=1 Tax=Henriciella sp. TaxID=1968823 RepID=UPI00183B63F7|nr:epoxide hydrolase family protein [Henriciella sp.]HIG22382.1 epoxide hydrolase [Henriciella sp.]HIK65813.1 epoxide hydrolase [Henriciella marina]
MSKVTPFTINVSDDVLSRIRARVEAYRWFPAPAIADEWAFGMSTAFLKDIQAYWLEQYDWRAAEKALNAWPQFKTKIDGLDIHFLHVVGEAGGKRPLLLTHGWPGSVYEFYEAIGPLAFPSKHGGNAEDAFDLVIPSLPGYGFSGKPAAPTGQQATARMWDTLMRERLGYDTYLAQGGDWGGLVTSLLGLNHGTDSGGGCKAIHLNMIGHQPADRTPSTDEEKKWIASSQAAMQAEGAYLMEQATKPQTLAMALMDSPMGTAAWILEKFHGWSDRSRGTLTDIYSRDQLLTNVMIYLVNDAIATSVWYYAALFLEGGAQLKPDQKVNVPTGIADYPGETIYTTPPRSWCERIYNVAYWSDMKEGGHFAAMEVPDLYVEDVRAWARAVS